MKLYIYQVKEGTVVRAEQASRRLAERYMKPGRTINRILWTVTIDSVMCKIAARENQLIFEGVRQ